MPKRPPFWIVFMVIAVPLAVPAPGTSPPGGATLAVNDTVERGEFVVYNLQQRVGTE
jgi:hypothetical protein